MRLIPNSNGEDNAPLREDNYCQLPDGRLAPKGQGTCQRPASAGGPSPSRLARAAYVQPLPASHQHGAVGQPSRLGGEAGTPKQPSPQPARKFVRKTRNTDTLTSGAVVGSQEINSNTNEVLKVRLQGEEGRVVTACFKPISGEDRTAGRTTMGNLDCTLAEREVAAYEVDQILGVGLTPETVMREIRGKPGMVMEWKENAVDEWEWEGRDMTADELYKMCVLDYVIGNTDRHKANYKRDRNTGKPWAIDHGYSFNTSADMELRSHPIAELLDRRMSDAPTIPPALATKLQKRLAQADWKGFLDTHSFSQDQRNAFLYRVDMMKQNIYNLPDFFANLKGPEDWRMGN